MSTPGQQADEVGEREKEEAKDGQGHTAGGQSDDEGLDGATPGDASPGDKPTPHGEAPEGTPTPGATPGGPGAHAGHSADAREAAAWWDRFGLLAESPKEQLPKHHWSGKVARFIAFCVDGGLLSS